MITDPLVGRTIGGYRVDALIGRGGMSRVYQAEQTSLQRQVALKVLSAHLADDAEYRERFLRECRLAASIEHPNIVPIYDAGESDGYLYIAMRLVRGTDLRTTLQSEGALAVPRALAILKQTALALDAAHAVGLVHRDVKPANLLVAGDHVYLTDFGVAKMGEGGSQLTRVGVFVGTIDYAAPEQIRNEPIDGRTDIYSLACVFYECLTGRTPFNHPTDHAVLQAQLMEAAPSARELRPDLPASLDAVLGTAMSKEKEGRYRSAALFAEAARLAIEGRAAAARPTVIEQLGQERKWAGPPFVVPSTREPPGASVGNTSPRRRSWRTLAVILVAALVIGGGAVVAARGMLSSLVTAGSQVASGQAVGTTPPPPRTAPTTAPPTTAPPPFAGRPVTLKPQDVIMPPGEFPFRGYTIDRDNGYDFNPFSGGGGGSWGREFSSSSLDYYYIQIDVSIYPSSTSGASQLARATCDITFPIGKPTVSEVTAEVIADGAKACQYHFEGNTADWAQYITATRNVVISVAGEPRLFSISNTAAMSQMIALARQQIAIIDRVAPR